MKDNLNEWYDYTAVSQLEEFILSIESFFRGYMNGDIPEKTSIYY